MATYDNSGLIQGNDLHLFIAGKAVAYGTSLSLDVSQDTIDVTSKFSGKWKSNIAGKLSYTISSDATYTKTTGDTTFSTLMAAMVAQTPVAFTFSSVSGSTYTVGAITSGTTYFSGTALITSLGLKADQGDVAKFSIQLQGVDALTVV